VGKIPMICSSKRRFFFAPSIRQWAGSKSMQGEFSQRRITENRGLGDLLEKITRNLTRDLGLHNPACDRIQTFQEPSGVVTSLRFAAPLRTADAFAMLFTFDCEVDPWKVEGSDS
jgi:hypothetical protein